MSIDLVSNIPQFRFLSKRGNFSILECSTLLSPIQWRKHVAAKKLLPPPPPPSSHRIISSTSLNFRQLDDAEEPSQSLTIFHRLKLLKMPQISVLAQILRACPRSMQNSHYSLLSAFKLWWENTQRDQKGPGGNWAGNICFWLRWGVNQLQGKRQIVIL